MASIPRGAAAVIAGAFLSFGVAAADLFNNTNPGGVANKPTNQTIFLTPGSTHITELVTYH